MNRLVSRLEKVDPEERGIKVSKQRLVVVQGGACDTYDISLRSPPPSTVVISIRATLGAVYLKPDTILIQPQDYNIPKRVVVLADANASTDTDTEETELVHYVTSQSERYDGLLFHMVVYVVEKHGTTVRAFGCNLGQQLGISEEIGSADKLLEREAKRKARSLEAKSAEGGRSGSPGVESEPEGEVGGVERLLAPVAELRSQRYVPSRCVSLPTQVEGLVKKAVISGMSGGAEHTCIVLTNGKVVSWGSPRFGQTGRDVNSGGTSRAGAGAAPSPTKTPRDQSGGSGDFSRRPVQSVCRPADVQGVQNEFIVQVACGEHHTVILTVDGRLLSFGLANSGRLGVPFKDLFAKAKRSRQLPIALDIAVRKSLSRSAERRREHLRSAMKEGGDRGDRADVEGGESDVGGIGISRNKSAERDDEGNGLERPETGRERLKEKEGTVLRHRNTIKARERTAEKGKQKDGGTEEPIFGFTELPSESQEADKTRTQSPPRDALVLPSIAANQLLPFGPQGQDEDEIASATAARFQWSEPVGESGLPLNDFYFYVDRPWPIPGLTGVLQIACGGAFTACIARRDPTDGKKGNAAAAASSPGAGAVRDTAVFTWGAGSSGCLGHGGLGDEWVPREVRGLRSGVLQIACGRFHLAMLTLEGHVLTCGEGEDGRLGHGDTVSRSIPTRVLGLPICRAVECGRAHTGVIDADLGVLVWGSNGCGQLGLTTSGLSRTQRASGLVPFVPVPRRVWMLDGKGVCQLSFGANHSACLTLFGVLYTWGANHFGQLGHGTTRTEMMPRAVSALLAHPATQVLACGDHTITLSLFTYPVFPTDGGGGDADAKALVHSRQFEVWRRELLSRDERKRTRASRMCEEEEEEEELISVQRKSLIFARSLWQGCRRAGRFRARQYARQRAALDHVSEEKRNREKHASDFEAKDALDVVYCNKPQQVTDLSVFPLPPHNLESDLSDPERPPQQKIPQAKALRRQWLAKEKAKETERRRQAQQKFRMRRQSYVVVAERYQPNSLQQTPATLPGGVDPSALESPSMNRQVTISSDSGESVETVGGGEGGRTTRRRSTWTEGDQKGKKGGTKFQLNPLSTPQNPPEGASARRNSTQVVMSRIKGLSSAPAGGSPNRNMRTVGISEHASVHQEQNLKEAAETFYSRARRSSFQPAPDAIAREARAIIDAKRRRDPAKPKMQKNKYGSSPWRFPSAWSEAIWSFADSSPSFPHSGGGNSESVPDDIMPLIREAERRGLGAKGWWRKAQHTTRRRSGAQPGEGAACVKQKMSEADPEIAAVAEGCRNRLSVLTAAASSKTAVLFTPLLEEASRARKGSDGEDVGGKCVTLFDSPTAPGDETLLTVFLTVSDHIRSAAAGQFLSNVSENMRSAQTPGYHDPLKVQSVNLASAYTLAAKLGPAPVVQSSSGAAKGGQAKGGQEGQDNGTVEGGDGSPMKGSSSPSEEAAPPSLTQRVDGNNAAASNGFFFGPQREANSARPGSSEASPKGDGGWVAVDSGRLCRFSREGDSFNQVTLFGDVFIPGETDPKS